MSPSSSVYSHSGTSELQRVLEAADERWEVFPEPSPGGYWIPMDCPFPPPKFPGTLSTEAPADPPLLNPPVRQFHYPPPTSRWQNSDWFSNMLADLEREHVDIHRWGEGCSASINRIDRISRLGVAGLAEEGEEMQGFLNMLGKVGGSGFLKEMLQDVQTEVNGVML